MAADTIITTLAPPPVSRTFRGVDNPVAQGSARGEVTFNVLGDAVTLSGALQDQMLIINSILPVNYAHCLVDLSVRLESALVAVDLTWDNCALGIFHNASSANQTNQFTIPMCASGKMTSLVAGKAQQNFIAETMPKMIMHPALDSSAVRLQCVFVNPNIEEPAIACFFYARFLQYDILQADNYTVNNPALVR